MSFQVDGPRFLFKDQLSEIVPCLDPKFKYGVLYFDGQFNDSKLSIETILTSTALNLDSEGNSDQGKVNYLFLLYINVENLILS